MREKPKLREQLLEVEGLGSVMVRNVLLERWLELLQMTGIQRDMAVLQETVFEKDGSPIGWDANDWHVFASNHPESYRKLLVAAMREGDAEKKEEAPS